MSMHTHTATKEGGTGWTAGTREWVFNLLPSRRYRERADLLSNLELNRRADCEPTLRALVLDEWTPDADHHLGWCESCRSAGLALGRGAPQVFARSAGSARRRIGWVVLGAAIAIAAPLVAANSLLDDSFSGQEPRGGVAITSQQVPPAPPKIVVVPRNKPPVTPSVRHKRSSVTVRGQHARTLPHTT